jgi:spermidine synthase
MLNEKYRRQPVTYFCPDTGIGRAMGARKPGVPAQIGILGLGCGTLAAYGRPGDTFRIYEINPQMLDLANSEFTFLRDTPAKVEVALGDGRLTLEREPSRQFDLLVMDAFSGDSVPVHLVTREAFAIYFRHLKPGGIIAVNTTNTFLDLRPMIERAAASFAKLAIFYDFEPYEDDFLCFNASWILVTDPSIRQTDPDLVKAGQVLPPHPAFRVWTDDYSNMWGILR